MFAKEAGVSVATVSRVQREAVTYQMSQQKVNETIARLNYSNFTAKKS